jgi:hypothetical protein
VPNRTENFFCGRLEEKKEIEGLKRKKDLIFMWLMLIYLYVTLFYVSI